MRPKSPLSYSVARFGVVFVALAACCCPLLTDRQPHHAMGAEPADTSEFIVVGAIELPGIPKIYRINVDGSNRELLKSGGFDPALSPDGKQVAFITGGDKTAGVYLINTDGSGLKRIAENAEGTSPWLAPRWSPDGQQIAFCDPFGDAMFVMDADGSNLRRVGLGGGLFPNWSPDGRQLLFTRMSDGAPELFAIDVDGIEHRKLLDGTARMGTWSPDGKWLAYVVRDGRKAGLYVAKADGTQPKRLAGGPNEITLNPEWSRDSQRIFFTWMAGIEPKEESEILEREAAGLEGIDNSELPAPSAVHVIDLDGQNLRRITNADSMEYSGGSLLYIEGNTSWSDLAERTMPSTSWEEVPVPKAEMPIEDVDKAVAEWVHSAGGHVSRSNFEPGRPIYQVFFLNQPVKDADLERLPRLKNLTDLTLIGTGVTDVGLSSVARCENLQRLDLRGNPVTDRGLKELSACKKLGTLGLESTRVTDAGLKHLADFEGLGHLSLSKSQISDATLRVLRKIDRLRLICGGEQFDLSGTRVTDKGLTELVGLQTLTGLNLAKTAVSDMGLRTIAELKGLQYLTLDFTSVTDNGMKELATLKKLRTVKLAGTSVSHVGVRELKRRKPDLGVSPSSLEDPPLTAGEQQAIAWSRKFRGGQLTPWIENGGVMAEPDGESGGEITAPPEEMAEPWAESGHGQPLTELDLANSRVTDADLKELAGFEGIDRLHSLFLRSTQVTDAGLKDVAKLATLRSLDLSDTKVTDNGIGELAGLQDLKSLSLGETAVTGVGFGPLSKLKHLTYLSLGRSKISDAGLKNVAALKNLESLDLYDTGVTASGLRNLAGLKRLQNLTLNFEAGRGRRAERTTIAKLHALREAGLLHAIPQTEPRHGSIGPRPTTAEGITNLSLYWNWLTDAALREFADFKNVQDIQLDGSKITDAGLKTVGTFMQLKRLSLSNTRVTDAGLKELAGITTLQDLKLDSTKVGDLGLKAIGGLKNLQQLNLANTKVTDRGLKELKGLKKLRRLHLYDTNVTKAGLTDLRKALPQLRVVHPLVP